MDGLETTTDPLYADDRNFYKVELWSKDGHIERMLFAGNRIADAHQHLMDFARRRPRARLTIRQRSRLVAKWPDP
jgi:hypothetical protein